MEKDCRKYLDKVKRLKFGEGDAEAIQDYFTKFSLQITSYFMHGNWTRKID